MKKSKVERALPVIIRLVLSITLIVIAIVNLVKVTPDYTTLEQAVSNFKHLCETLFYFSFGLCWAISAAISALSSTCEELENRIKLLEAKLEKGDTN